LRFAFVRGDACTSLSEPGFAAKSKTSACFAPFSSTNAFTGAFSGVTTYFNETDGSVLSVRNYTYDFGMTHLSTLEGLFNGAHDSMAIDYGKLGYSFIMPSGDRASSQRMIQNVIDDGLISDSRLRAIGITFNLFNTNSRFVTVGRLVLEVLESGYLLQSAYYTTVPIPELFTTQTGDLLTLSFMIIFLVFFGYYLQKVS